MNISICDRNRARRDVVWIVAATVDFAVFCASLELSETVLASTRPHERLQLDGFPGILLLQALALAWYASRRVREARTEVILRAKTEARLREAFLQNRELARACVRIQEVDRRILARELHNELGQYLNAVKIDAVCVRDGDWASPFNVHGSAVAIISMTDHLQVVVRDMTRRLRPVGLDELGLPAALKSCIEGRRWRMPLAEFAMAVGEDIGKLD